jgi:hypothetical protein
MLRNTKARLAFATVAALAVVLGAAQVVGLALSSSAKAHPAAEVTVFASSLDLHTLNISDLAALGDLQLACGMGFDTPQSRRRMGVAYEVDLHVKRTTEDAGSQPLGKA